MRELRRLEDEAVLAELDWKIERDFDEETGQLEPLMMSIRCNPKTTLSLS